MAFLVYTQILYSSLSDDLSTFKFIHSECLIKSPSSGIFLYLWSRPSCWAEITYSFRRVRPTDSKSPLSVMPISLVSLITLSQPSKHRYQTAFSIEILFPFPKALCSTYRVQPRKVVWGGGLLPWRIYIERLTQRSRLMTFVAGCDEERVTWCDEAVAGKPQSRTAHYVK